MELKRVDRLISKAKTWDELYKDLSTNKQFTQKFKGDVFERVTQAYLLTIPEYKSTLSEVWLTDEVPRTVLKKLNLPSSDFGVDLIAKTIKGEYWTIQCKFRTSNAALNYGDLSTFINQSFLTAKNIKLAIVAHTSSRPIKNRKFLKELSEIGAGRWLELTDEEWNNIRKFCNRKPVKIVKRKPRPHQRKAINKAKSHFLTKKNSRGKLIMPCATGKSLAAFWIAQALDSKKVIVAVPSLALVKQSLNDWTKEYMANGVTPEWLCICSDESTGKVDSDEFNTDTYDLGIPTTTDKAEIIEFLRRRTKSPKIIFTTYQSSPRLAAAAKASKTYFDLCILDEAHKTVGVQGKTFSTLLFDKEIKIKKRMFMTATERVLREKNDEVSSMDDPEIYGDYIYVMTFKDAIDENIISDYKIVTMLISNSEVDRLVDENYFLSTDLKKLDESSAQYLASGIALKKSFRKYKLKHAISFHRSIYLAKQFQKQQDNLNSVPSLKPKVKNLHISSKKSSGERTELIKEFTELDRSLLTNARCLTEGVDVPAIDCVMFVDPKQSTVDIVQAAGRALRKYPSKKYGYILLPIVVPDGVDFETFSETTAFRKIISIIAALSSQDERISEEYKIEERGKKSSGAIVNIESTIQLGKKIKIKDFSKAIDTRIWKKVGLVNRRNFKEARNFARNLNLSGSKEWSLYVQKENFPSDIPHLPNRYYAKKGWTSWGDWLGTGFIANKDKITIDFETARSHVRNLKLKNGAEWRDYINSDDFPDNFPRKPESTYKNNGWKGMGDWLGTGFIANTKRTFRPFDEARKFARSLGLNSANEWWNYASSDKCPKDIPFNPRRTYKNQGWNGYEDWLGKKKKKSFEENREYAISLKLNGMREWKIHAQKEGFPEDMARYPQQRFKNSGWKGWGDFLGTGRIATQDLSYKSFIEARKYARSLKLKSGSEWNKHTKEKNFPSDIPHVPGNRYKNNGWKGMGDWLGTGNIASSKRTFRPFDEARKYARSLKLKSGSEWNKHTKEKNFPSDIPKSAQDHYKNSGWKGWGDFLGTGRVAPKDFKSFIEARKYARSLKLKNSYEWNKHTKEKNFPSDIPFGPASVYRDKGYKGMGDWLGTGFIANTKRTFRSFDEARKYARSLNLSSGQSWKNLYRDKELPDDLPSSADNVYKDKGWKGWKDFLGK